MENNYETLRIPELKVLARERRLRGYSRLRKAELIAFLQDEDRQQEEPPTQQPELEVPQPLAVALTKRQLKRKQNKNSKLNKNFKNLSKEIINLKSRIEGLENKIAKATQSTNARFKRKKIRSMKRDVVKAIEKLKESEKSFESIESRIPKNNNSSKRIENKIAELNKKIRRAQNKKNKEHLLAKRDSLKIELSWGPTELEGAFGGAYRHYRIDGVEGKGHVLDVDTYFARTRKFLIDLLNKETTNRAVRSQATIWI